MRPGAHLDGGVLGRDGAGLQAGERVGPPAVHAGGADDETGAARVAQRHGTEEDERDEDYQQDDSSDDAHVILRCSDGSRRSVLAGHLPRPASYNARIVIIAIDGPSGAGKGTVARALAQDLNFTHIDTGAMYRAVGWLAIRQGVPFEDEAAVARLAAEARFDLSGGPGED